MEGAARGIAAYFDLDGTLLTVNSGRLWLQRERRVGRINWRQTLHGVGFLLAYRLGVVNIETATRAALATVRGFPEQEIRDWTREWFLSDVVRHTAPGGVRTVEAHRARGHRVVLLSSTSPYEAALAAAHFNLDEAISTRYEVQQGRFTGEPLLPICFGEGKIHYAEEHAAREGIDLERSYFYSDSYTDLPMLERVGRPRVVNPDLRLERRARRAGWPILDWTVPGEPRL